MFNKIINIILFFSLIGFWVYITLIRKYPEPEIVDDYQYKTDTLYKDTLYLPGKPYPVPTPPRTVKIYLTDSSVIDSLKLLLQDQEVIIAGLEDTIALHEAYLKQFPENPKILNMDLSRDTLNFGLLFISGQIQERSWPIDLNRFNYRWSYASDLSRHPTHSPPVQEKPFAEYYAGGGFDFLWLSPYLNGRIEKNWARFQFYGDAQIGLLNLKASDIKVGLNYKFNGQSFNREWKRNY